MQISPAPRLHLLRVHDNNRRVLDQAEKLCLDSSPSATNAGALGAIHLFKSSAKIAEPARPVVGSSQMPA